MSVEIPRLKVYEQRKNKNKEKIRGAFISVTITLKQLSCYKFYKILYYNRFNDK